MPPILDSPRILPALLKYTITNVFDSSGNPYLYGDGLYLIPVFLYQTTDIKSLNSIRSLHICRDLRTWLRIVLSHNLLTIPTSFPLVPLGRSFDPRAVVMN